MVARVEDEYKFCNNLWTRIPAVRELLAIAYAKQLEVEESITVCFVFLLRNLYFQCFPDWTDFQCLFG